MLTSSDNKKLLASANEALDLITNVIYSAEMVDEFSKWKLEDRSNLILQLENCKTDEDACRIVYGYYINTLESKSIAKAFDILDIASCELIRLDFENSISWLSSGKNPDDFYSAKLFASQKSLHNDLIEGITSLGKDTLCPILRDIHAIVRSLALRENLARLTECQR